jgi:hypothetical protein
MRKIDKTYLLELYTIHDQLARVITEIGAGSVYGGNQIEAINKADYLADQLEQKFAETLTPEERGERSED